jgi:hypothetical protein
VPGEPASWTTDLDDLGDPDHADDGLDLDLDLVESKPNHLTPRQRRWIGVGLVVAVLLAALAWYADGRRRVAEFDRLASCVAAGEGARIDAEARVAGMGSYVRPSLGVNPAPDVDQSLYRLVAQEAVVGEPEVRHSLTVCEHVGILPFHPSLKTARSAYVGYLGAELDRLSAIAADGSQAFESSEELGALRSQAFAELKSAAPDDSRRRRLDQVTRVDK